MLNTAVVEYAGAAAFGVRVDTAAALPWDRVTLSNNAGQGLDVQAAGATVTITNSNFTNAPGNGIRNDAARTVDASGSWWLRHGPDERRLEPHRDGGCPVGTFAALVEVGPFVY